MEEGGERPEQREFSGEIPNGRRPAVHAAVRVDDDHFFEKPLARHFRKVAGHSLIVERGEGESMPAIGPPEVRHALPAKSAFAVEQDGVAIRPGAGDGHSEAVRPEPSAL